MAKESPGEAWPKVVTVLSRGGRFQAYDKGYPGDEHRRGHLMRHM